MPRGTDGTGAPGDVRLETPRLIVREHRSTDLEAMHAMLTDPAILWYLPGLHKDSPEETAEYLIAALRAASHPLRTHYCLAVEERASGEPVGAVEAHIIEGAPDGAHYGLGYFIRADRWNLGYAAEVAGALLDYLFHGDAWRVSASCLAENLGSRRVLEKCGMRQEGLLARHTWHDGMWKDCAVYAILRDEYFAQAAR